MTKRASDSEDDVAAFAEAVRGTRRLGGKPRVSPDIGGADQVRLPSPARSRSFAVPVGAQLLVEQIGQTWAARADGIDRRIVRKLRDGAIPIESQIDLHGLTRLKAAHALDRFISASRAGGRRCLLVIHGRGLHSGPDGPALLDVVRAALTTGTHAAVVLVCASAAPPQGGGGATLVYLRR